MPREKQKVLGIHISHLTSASPGKLLRNAESWAHLKGIDSESVFQTALVGGGGHFPGHFNHPRALSKQVSKLNGDEMAHSFRAFSKIPSRYQHKCSSRVYMSSAAHGPLDVWVP